MVQFQLWLPTLRTRQTARKGYSVSTLERYPKTRGSIEQNESIDSIRMRKLHAYLTRLLTCYRPYSKRSVNPKDRTCAIQVCWVRRMFQCFQGTPFKSPGRGEPIGVGFLGDRRVSGNG